MSLYALYNPLNWFTNVMLNFTSGVLQGWPALVCVLASLVVAIALFCVFVPHEDESGRKGLRAFLNFDILWISPIVKLLYIFLAVCAAVFGVVLLAVSCINYARYGSDPSEIVSWVAANLFGFVAFQLVIRLSLEVVLLLVKIVENTTALRGTLRSVSSDLRAFADRASQGGAPQGAEAGAAVPFGGPIPPVDVEVRPVPPAYEPPASSQTYEPTAVMPQPEYHEGEQEIEDHDTEGKVEAETHGKNQSTLADEPEEAPGIDGAEVTTVMPAAADETAVADGKGGALPWDCSCGARGNTGLYCGMCGSRRPEGC